MFDELMNVQYDYILPSSKLDILNRTLHDSECGGHYQDWQVKSVHFQRLCFSFEIFILEVLLDILEPLVLFGA